MEVSSNWFVWALLSAVFAALTAIFAKVGLAGVDSDLATLVRTGIIGVVLAAFVVATGKWANPLTLPGKTLLFLLLSGLATGASWVCYFRALKIGDASKVAPVDKLSLVLVAIFAVLFLNERPAARESRLAVGPHGSRAARDRGYRRVVVSTVCATSLAARDSAVGIRSRDRHVLRTDRDARNRAAGQARLATRRLANGDV
jgi:transporter family protein